MSVAAQEAALNARRQHGSIGSILRHDAGDVVPRDRCPMAREAFRKPPTPRAKVEQVSDAKAEHRDIDPSLCGQRPCQKPPIPQAGPVAGGGGGGGAGNRCSSQERRVTGAFRAVPRPSSAFNAPSPRQQLAEPNAARAVPPGRPSSQERNIKGAFRAVQRRPVSARAVSRERAASGSPHPSARPCSAAAAQRRSSSASPDLGDIAKGQAKRPTSAAAKCRNFVAENAQPVFALPQKVQVVKPSEQRYSRDTANVPKYLQRVKDEVAAEADFIREKMGLNRGPNDPPPGYRWLPEEERLGLLEGLQMRKNQLDSQYAKMPLRIETEVQQRRMAALEQELKDVESKIRDMLQPRILVKI
eukprot:TRINITY_DN14319_c0_g3_i1.p1 TRINITY_DN14319_c0_g3~~TRINITY_DN14319_c0_g3_i1.p1  ORF type:complete len:358 (+),score=40.50 TRINITY_DN14319_c0_g3_i1:50-1123(+)